MLMEKQAEDLLLAQLDSHHSFVRLHGTWGKVVPKPQSHLTG